MSATKKSVLFVCTGNICRSPTAEGILRKQVERTGLNVHVDSAGTHGYHAGEMPDARAIRAAAQRGYDIAGIRARKLRTEDFRSFDYLIALDDGHLAILQQQCPPDLQHKLHRMMAFAPAAPHAEVPDPYYGSAAGFELVLDLLEQAVSGLLHELQAGE